MENILEVKNLNKKYKNFRLKNVTFSIPKGCIMGFIGENGAGKSTAIKAILNLISIDSGEVKIFGLDNKTHEVEIKNKIGVVFDENHFSVNLTPLNISLIMKNIYSAWDNKLYNYYLDKFQIEKNKIIKDFSRGMKMKLSIAAALSHKPQFLILDEATSGLDPVVREEILDIFLEFIQDENHSIFISSHITSDLEKIADYITFIHQGEIIFSENKDELIENTGILKCEENEIKKIDKKYIQKIRKNQFGFEALIKNKYEFKNKYDELLIDKASIEDIILFNIRGENI